jgi:hypothetical protein
MPKVVRARHKYSKKRRFDPSILLRPQGTKEPGVCRYTRRIDANAVAAQSLRHFSSHMTKEPVHMSGRFIAASLPRRDWQGESLQGSRSVIC